MRSMNGRARLAMTSLTVMAAILAGGCSGSEGASGKAGGAAPPVVLHMVNAYGDLNIVPAVQYFVSQVKERSGGNLGIELTNAYGDYADDAEQQVVRAVAAGNADLGWAGTRVFDTLGVTSFRALQAPMLIDSYPLEQAVITAGIPGQMAQDLDKIGVRSLAVLADGLRKPIGVQRPLLSPTDWRGITFGTFRSQGQAEAIKALGATPMNVFGRSRTEALVAGKLQGFEMSLPVYDQQVLARSAPYVTANISLWPQMEVLLANPNRFAKLSRQQRDWLEQAARDATARSTAPADDASSLENACQTGARFASASKDQMAKLQQAFRPVLASLEEDAKTKAFLEQIQQLKLTTPAGEPLPIPAQCTGRAPEEADENSKTVPTELNGTYRYVLTKDDARKGRERILDEFPNVTTVTLRDGRVKGGCFEEGATYWVSGKRITFNAPAYGYTMTFDFSADGKGNLQLTPVQPMDRGDAFQCSYKPWIKIG
jgi:TRAP-type C4-dicarboxylate transport system substrate-binding protein